MLRCYPQVQIGDGEVYTAALVSVLVRYPEAVILAVTEPATGIVSRCKWPPAIAELVEACEKAAGGPSVRRTWDDAVRETLSRRAPAALIAPSAPEGPREARVPVLRRPSAGPDDEYQEFVAGRRGRGTRPLRTRHIGEVLCRHGFNDLAAKLNGS